MMTARKPYPSDVSDEEWALAVPYLTLLPETAGQRAHLLREAFNGLRYVRAVRFWAWAVRESGLRGRRIMAARAPLTAATALCWSRHGAVRRPARRPGSDPRPAPPAGSP